VSDLAAANAVIRDLYTRVGANIQRAREQRGITQAELGAAIGLTRPSVTNVEAGNQRTPLHMLIAIAQTLDLPFAALVDGDLPEFAMPLPPDVERIRASLKGLRDELDAALVALDGRGRHRGGEQP
jgi:transcriptional regulator with XRE-family HTH domain